MNKDRLIAVGLVVLLFGSVGYGLYATAQRVTKIQEQNKTIAGLRGNVSYFESEVSELKGEVRSLNQSVFSLKEEKTELEKEAEIYKIRLKRRKERIEDLSDKIKGLKEEGGIDYTPSLSEVRSFLWRDDTNKKEYRDFDQDNPYVCYHFAYDLVNNLIDEGIYACTVVLPYGNFSNSHKIVAVETERGIAYIEPQDDTIVYDLEVGDDYCDKVDWDCELIVDEIKTCYDR